jgi:site-specific DNA-adenine methylase
MVYQGSKASIAGWLVQEMTPYLKEASFYYEPFMGGANLLCRVPHSKRIGSDVNRFLVALLSRVRDDPSCLPGDISEGEYLRVTRSPWLFPDWYVGLVSFCATFRGIYRGGYARMEGSVQSCLNNLRLQAPLLQGIELRCSDYRTVNFKLFPGGGLVLADIPYRGTSGYRFRFEHDEFYRWCRYVHGLGHTVLLTEFWAPSVFEEVGAVERADHMTAGRSSVKERLFVYRG